MLDLYAYIITIGVFACVGEDTAAPFCATQIEQTTVPWWDTTYRTALEDIPPVGGGYWFRVDAVDGAGNVSPEVCP